MAYENITLDVSPEGTAVLTLNRPAKRNAFNAPTIEELSDAFETLSKNPECRLLLIRGAGPVFSAGAGIWKVAESGIEFGAGQVWSNDDRKLSMPLAAPEAHLTF